MSKKGGRINPVEWAAFTVVLLVAHALGFLQAPMSVNDGLGWDGFEYYLMAEQAMAGQEFKRGIPFVYRQLLPTLAGFFAGSSDNLLATFRLINLFFGTAAAVFILLLLQEIITDWRLRVVAASLYPLHFLGYIRFSHFYATQTDAAMVASVAAALYLTQRIRAEPRALKWIVLLAALCFIAVLNRGTALVLGLLAPLCAAFPKHETTLQERLLGKWRQLRPIWFVPLFAGFVAYWWTHSNVHITQVWVATGGYAIPGVPHFLSFMLKVIYEKPLAHYLQGIFYAYGPSLALVLWQWRAVVAALRMHWHWLALMGIFALYAFNDPERMMMHMVSLYTVLLAIALQHGWDELKDKKFFIIVLLVAQAVSQRLFWLLPTEIPGGPDVVPPDTPLILPLLFTPFTDNFLYYDLHPHMNLDWGHNRGAFGLLTFAQYMLFIVAALFYLNLFPFSGKNHRKRKNNRHLNRTRR